MKVQILVAVVSLIFLSHCKSGKNDVKDRILGEVDKPVNVKIRKVNHLSFHNLVYPRLFLFDQKVIVSGYDANAGKNEKKILKIYDQELNFVKRLELPVGQGPGDIGLGTTFSKAGDEIFAADNILRRIAVFDNDFNFKKIVKVNDSYLSTQFSENGKFFYAIDMKYDKNKRIYYDLIRCSFPSINKKIIHTVGPLWPFTQGKKVIVGAIPILSFFVRGEEVFFLNACDYRIIRINSKGNIVDKVRFNIQKQKVPQDKEREWLFEQQGNWGVNNCEIAEFIQPASWIVPLEKGFVVVRRESLSSTCEGMVEADYFDFDLNPLGKIQFPCFFRIFEVKSIRMPDSCGFSSGYLYLIKEDEQSNDFFLEKWQLDNQL